ncbi:unnamed protein product [Dicrocoelium dendriticum]|nr:unnamed protein product [Dicrocoelium dendriticum]
MLSSTAAENLACTDEVKVYEDEGEEEEQKKSSENLTEDKVRLVIESETQIPRIFDFFGKNGGASLFKMPFLTDPRLASYFLPGYPAAIAAAMAAVNAASASSGIQSSVQSTVSSTTTPGDRTSFPVSSPAGTTWPNSSTGHLCSASHSSFWPTPFGSGGSSSGSSSGYASSEGSVGNAGNGWFNSTMSPSGFNFSQYYPYPNPPSTLRHPRITTHPPGRSTNGSNADLPPTDHPPNSTLAQPLSSYATNPFGLMPFYGPFGCGAAAAAAAAAAVAAAAYSHQPGTPPGTTSQSKGETNSGAYLVNGKPDWKLKNPSLLVGHKTHPYTTHLPKEPDWIGTQLGHRKPSRSRSAGRTHSPPPLLPPSTASFTVSSGTELAHSPVSDSVVPSNCGSAFTSLHAITTSAVSSTRVIVSPSTSISASTSNIPTPQSNFYAAAACAAAMAAAVASWNGAGSPQSHGQQRATPTQIQKSPTAHLLPSPSALFSRPRNSSGGTNVSVRSPAFSSGIPTPGSPKSSNLAAAAAVVAALSPTSALYQRRDSGRTSVSNNSTVASPYSPSMFAAAAAAHMQLLSAAAAAASFGSNLSSSPSSALSMKAAATPTTTSHMINLPNSTAPIPSSDVTGDRRSGTMDICGAEVAAIANRSAFWNQHQHTLQAASGSTCASVTCVSPASAIPVPHHPPSLVPCAPWYRRTDTERPNKFQDISTDVVVSRTHSPHAYRKSSSPLTCDSMTVDDRTVAKKTTGSKGIHIKKPLNAFMLFMKEMRARVQEECTLKESAAINQVLGRKWHELTREEQTKYYEMARHEKELHQQLYPNWSARDNYAYHARKRKRRRHLLHRHVLQSRTSRQPRVGHPSRQMNRFASGVSAAVVSENKDASYLIRRPQKVRRLPQSSPLNDSSALCQSNSPASNHSVLGPETNSDSRILLSKSGFPHSASGICSSTVSSRFLERAHRSSWLSTTKDSPRSASSLGDLRSSAPGSGISDFTPVSDQLHQVPDRSVGTSSGTVDKEFSPNMSALISPQHFTQSCLPASSPNSLSSDKQPNALSSAAVTPFTTPSRAHASFMDKLSANFSSRFAKPVEPFADPVSSHACRLPTTVAVGPLTDAHSKSADIFSPDFAASAAVVSSPVACSSAPRTLCFTSSSPTTSSCRPAHSSLAVPPLQYRSPCCHPPPSPGSKFPQFSEGSPLGFFPHTRRGPGVALPGAMFGSRSSSISGLLGANRRMLCYNGGRHTLHPSSSPSTAAAVAAAMAAGELTGGSLKKCRARFGLEHQNMWCKPCRRKKKCIRFISDSDVDEFPLSMPHLPSSHHMDYSEFPGPHLNRQSFSNIMDPFATALRASHPPIQTRHSSPLSSSFLHASLYRPPNPHMISQAKTPSASIDGLPILLPTQHVITATTNPTMPRELYHSNRSPFHFFDKPDSALGPSALLEPSHSFGMSKHPFKIVNSERRGNALSRPNIFGRSPPYWPYVTSPHASDCHGLPRPAHQAPLTNPSHQVSLAVPFPPNSTAFPDTGPVDRRKSASFVSCRSYVNRPLLNDRPETNSLLLRERMSSPSAETIADNSVVSTESHLDLPSPVTAPCKVTSDCLSAVGYTLESPASKRMCILPSPICGNRDLSHPFKSTTPSSGESANTPNGNFTLSPVKSLSPSIALNLKLSESVRFGVTGFVQPDTGPSTPTFNGVDSSSPPLNLAP